jgi:hypothetical protein
MKNILRTAFFLALLTVCFASCKTHERCPAYGKAATEKPARGHAG